QPVNPWPPHEKSLAGRTSLRYLQYLKGHPVSSKYIYTIAAGLQVYSGVIRSCKNSCHFTFSDRVHSVPYSFFVRSFAKSRNSCNFIPKIKDWSAATE